MKEALNGLPGILVSLCHPRGCLTVFGLYFISAHIQMPQFPAERIFSVLPYYFTKFIPNWNAVFKVVWDSRLNSKAIYCSIVKPSPVNTQLVCYYYCKHPEPRGSLKIQKRRSRVLVTTTLHFLRRSQNAQMAVTLNLGSPSSVDWYFWHFRAFLPTQPLIVFVVPVSIASAVPNR